MTRLFESENDRHEYKHISDNYDEHRFIVKAHTFSGCCPSDIAFWLANNVHKYGSETYEITIKKVKDNK